MIYIISAVLGILSSRYLYMFLIFPGIYLYSRRIMKYGLRKSFYNILIFFLFFAYSYSLFNGFNEIDNGVGIIYEKKETEYGAKYLIYNNPFRKILLYSSDASLEEGDKIKYDGEWSNFKQNSMPHLFNEKIYYNSIGVNSKIQKANIKKVSNSVIKPLFGIKHNFRQIYKENLNDNAYYLSSGAVLRKTEENLIYDKMEFAGLSHILSTSGLHVAILYGFIFFFVGLLIKSIKFRTFISILIIWIYGFMLVFPPSLLRALIMISVVEFAKLYNPSIKRKDSLKYAFFISLFFNPYYIFNVGFILSYLCVFSIFYVAPYFRKYIKRKSAFLEILNVDISIILLTLPLTIYFFNHYNLLTVLWNLIYVPIFSVYINLSFIFLFVYRLPIISVLIKFTLNIIANSVNLLLSTTSFKFLVVILKTPSILSIALYYFAIYIYIEQEYIRLRFFIKIRKLMPYLISLLIMPILFVRDSDFINFLDVGQGDSCHIHIDGKNYLVDSGGNVLNPGVVGKYILEPYLIKNGFRNIDGAFISHFDYDHYGALTEISDDIKIKHYISDHMPNKIDNESINKIINKIELVNKTEIDLNKIYSFKIITYNKDASTENNSSMIMLLRNKKYNLILFTGDIESSVEDQIYDKNIKSFILKVPHHGSKSSSTERFLNNVDPKYAIISVGANNKYGHPNDSVISRLEKKNLVFRTDKDGMITYNLNDNSIVFYNRFMALNEIIYTIFIILISLIIIRKVDRNDGLYKFFEES